MQFITEYWIEWLFGLVTAALAAGYRNLSKKYKAQKVRSQAVEEGVLALLHDRLYQACTHYIQDGKIDVDALKNVEYLYKAYHALGGNGTGTELYNRVKSLKIIDN